MIPMNVLFATSVLMLFSTGASNAQRLGPEDVLHFVGEHHLKYKHFLAYANLEVDGKDPSILQNQEYIQKLTMECIEKFLKEPSEFSQRMDQHYEMMTNMNSKTQNIQITNQSEHSFNDQNQWKTLLSGSVLYTTSTESNEYLMVQNTQILHLCPNGIAHNYSMSGGGGSYAGIDVSNSRQMHFEGSFQWNIIEQNGIPYFQFTMQGMTRVAPISILNQKVVIQGLGAFSIQQGGAQCL